jgi:hypothetical protein
VKVWTPLIRQRQWRFRLGDRLMSKTQIHARKP